MPTVNFGSFTKRKNSTKQPGGLGDSRICKLKETTSLDAPTFIIQGNDFDYNYCEWNGRYYFITDIRSVHNNLSEIDCELDVLATYKDYILNTTAYVLYDSVPNTELPDNRLPIKTTKSVQVSTVPCPFALSAGTYILSVTGSNGSTGVYRATLQDIQNLMDDISNIYDNLFDYESQHPAPVFPSGTHNVEEVFEYWTEWIKWLWESIKYPITQLFGSGNIPENIRECKFIPFTVGVNGHHADPLCLGTFETSIDLYQLGNETEYKEVDVTIPWQSTDFRRRTPYTDIYLYLPYIGMVKLSSENLVNQNSIHVGYGLSIRNGDIVCTVSSGSQILGQYSGNVATEVPIGFSNISLAKQAQAIIAGAAAAATDSIAALGMATLNFGNTVNPNYSSIGGLGGLAATSANQNITCYTVFHDTIAPPNQNLQVIGSPTMHSKSLGSLTGYCQCVDAHVEAPAMSGELESIDNYLNTGFFIE